jgi:hypothetical protein
MSYGVNKAGLAIKKTRPKKPQKKQKNNQKKPLKFFFLQFCYENNTNFSL